jgi:N-methylhydantoinase B
MMDGIDGASFTGGWLRNIPNEMLEADMPVLVEEYGYRPNSPGAGRWRGGAGIRFRLRAHAPETLMTARGLERFTFRPYGLYGGKPGALGSARLNPGTPRERELGKIDVLTLDPGDVVQFDTASGGGYGDPYERDPELVVADVEAGYLDSACAEVTYGVVVHAGRLDPEATAARRANRPPDGVDAFFDGGPERAAYEARWPGWLQEELTAVVLGYPSALRTWLQRRLVAQLDGTSPAPGSVAGLAKEVLGALQTDAGAAS